MNAVPVLRTPLAAALHLGEFLPPLVACGIYLFLYARRAGTLVARRQPITGWRAASFAAGAVLRHPPPLVPATSGSRRARTSGEGRIMIGPRLEASRLTGGSSHDWPLGVKVGIVVPYSWSFWRGVVEHAEAQARALRALGIETPH